MASWTTRGLGLTPPLFRLMRVRSSVNACWISSQKSSSCATSPAGRPPSAPVRRGTRSRPSFLSAGIPAPAATIDSTKRRRVSMGSPSPERAAYHDAVRDDVHDQNQRTQELLRRPREPGRIEHGNHVVLDEPARVALEPRSTAQVMLQWRERTDPALVLDERAPDRAGDVAPHEPAPAPGEEPAQHHEDDEGRVQQHDRVGEQAIRHLQTFLNTARSPAGPASDGESPFPLSTTWRGGQG